MADKVMIEFVDQPDTPNPVVMQVTAAQVAGNGDEFANGLHRSTAPTSRYEMTFASGQKVAFDAWDFFLGLGRFAKTWRKKDRSKKEVLYHRIPSVNDVLQLLERRRRAAFNTLRTLLATPEAFVAGMNTPIDPSACQDVLDSGQVAMPCHIYVRDLMIYWVRKTYKALPDPDLGWRRGVRVEMSLMSTRIPNEKRWSERARNLHRRFFLQPEADEDIGGFALPTPGGTSGGGSTEESRDESSTGPRHDPTRLLFHMGQRSYREIRSLDARNPYGYCVSCFDNNRCIVDTERHGNALFCMEGPLQECLTAATGTKQNIQSSPHFVRRIIHDAQGRWRTTETEWLDS